MEVKLNHRLHRTATSPTLGALVFAWLTLNPALALADIQVEDVSYTATAHSGRLELDLNGSPHYNIFSLENPPRAVIDISDAYFSGNLPAITPGTVIKDLRSGTRNGHDLRLVLESTNALTIKDSVQPSADSKKYRLIISAALPGAAPASTQNSVVPKAVAVDFAQIMEEARQAMVNNDYNRAIALYTKVLSSPDNEFHQDAQEFLGLARERNGQFAHAKAEYETYLRLYPKTEGAARVQQRLTGLLTAQAPAKEKLQAEKPRKIPTAWNVRGGFSQYYRRYVSTTDATGSVVNQSELDTDFDVFTQYLKPDYQLQSRFTGGYRNDFTDHTVNNPLRITSLYFDAADRRRDTQGRIGRQTLSRGGVLGRFDGLFLSRQLTPMIKLNLVSGYPVDSSTIDKIATDTQFYGVNADLGTYANAWDFNVFAIEQTSEGLLDRRAIGTEIRYFQMRHSALGLVDYDVSYHTMNMLLLLGNWLFADNTTLNVVYDQRKSPILTTRNALIGQLDASLTALSQRYTEDQIRSLALDRSADSRTYTASLTHPISDKLQIGGDLTLSTLSGTPASGGVEAMPGSGNDWSYSLQLIGSDLIKNGDIAILGVRRGTNNTADTTSISINTRYPVNLAWRINPIVRISQRNYKSDGSTQWTFAPTVRVDYRMQRNLSIELETGGEWTSRDMSGTTDKYTGYYLSLGYRADF